MGLSLEGCCIHLCILFIYKKYDIVLCDIATICALSVINTNIILCMIWINFHYVIFISGKKSFVKYLFSELCGINWIQGPPLGSPVIERHHLLFRRAWEGNVQNALLLSRLVRFPDPPYRRLGRGTWLYLGKPPTDKTTYPMLPSNNYYRTKTTLKIRVLT